MTTYYVDNTGGSDTTGDGSPALPYKTYNKAYTMLGGNGQHTIFLKRGTTEVLAASVSMRSGTSATARSVLDAYGDGAPPVLQAGVQLSDGLMWHLNGSQYKTIRNIVFDANRLAKAATQVYATSSAITDLRFEFCWFKNPRLTGGADSWYAQSETGFPLVSQVSTFRCTFSGASRHGVHHFGNVQATHEQADIYNNGLFDTGGGHGASSYAGIINNVTSGWTLVSGTIYKRTVTSTVWHAQRTGATPVALKMNTATPGTPAVGEWGQTGGELYINIGADPATINIRFSQQAPTVVYLDCKSHHNVASDAAKAEGTGFQSDDLTGSFTAIRCVAYSNEGPGFFLNQGRDAVLQSCVAYNNGNLGFGGQYFSGVTLDNITSTNNCVNNVAGNNGDVKFQLGTRDVAYRNSVVQKGTSTVATASIRHDADSQVGCSLTDVYYFGAPLSVGSVTQTRVTNADPMFNGHGRPKVGSPLIRSGTHLGFRRDVERKQMSRPPNIGAYSFTKMRSRL